MNSLPTWYSASVDQSPNQFKTHLKHKAFVKDSPKYCFCSMENVHLNIQQLPVEEGRRGSCPVLQALRRWIHSEHNVEIANNLAGEPFVEFFV